MKPLTFDLRNAKKVSSDGKTSTFSLQNGHSIKIIHSLLPPLQKRQIEKIPIQKGKVQMMADGDPSVSNDNYGDPPSGTFRWDSDSSNAAPADAPPTRDPASAADAPTWVQNVHNWLASRPNIQNDPVTTVQQDAADSIGQSTPDPNESFAGTIGHLAPDLPPKIDPTKYTHPETENFQQNSRWLSPNNIYGQEAAGIQGRARAEGMASQDQYNAEKAYQNQLANEAQRFDDGQQMMQENIKAALSDVKNGHINPKAYMENMGTEQKVATGIGLFLGGLSTPFTHQGNPAMDFLNKQIDRDVEAQKANQNTKMNVYNAYLEQYKNAAIAENMTRATQAAIYGSKIKDAAEKNGSAMATANAQMALGQLQQQIYPLIQKANFLQQTDAIDRRAQGNGQLSALEPEKLVQYSGAPAEDQNKMYEEIKNAKNINNVRQPSLDAFDRAANEVRPLSGGTGSSLTAFVPGMESPGQKAWSGLANTTVKEIEGTARKAAMDSLANNYKPQFGDSDSTIQSKRAGWQTYLNSQSASPVSNGYHINLKNYNSTAPHIQVQPVERIGKDGRVGLFNPQTKQFLGYK